MNIFISIVSHGQSQVQYKTIKSNSRTLQESNSSVIISEWWDIRWFLFPFLYFSRASAKDMNDFSQQKVKKYRTLFLSTLWGTIPWTTCSVPPKAASLSPFYRWTGWASERLNPLPRVVQSRHSDLQSDPGVLTPAHSSFLLCLWSLLLYPRMLVSPEVGAVCPERNEKMRKNCHCFIQIVPESLVWEKWGWGGG